MPPRASDQGGDGIHGLGSCPHHLSTPQEKKDPLSHFCMDTLLMTTHNLLFGGTETVGTTLRHAFLILMKYPKVQGVPVLSSPSPT